MRELQLRRAGALAWADRPEPELVERTDAIVRPFLAGRCDGDTVPLHRPVSRAMQLGVAVRAIDPVVKCICGRVPFRGPFAIGHECVAQIVALGDDVAGLGVGQTVVVPWAVSCGRCERCLAGLTSKCMVTTTGELAAYGFGPASGPWGGMVSDLLRVPFAEHMLVPVPNGVPPARAAAASDNLADAWRAVVGPLRERPGGRVLVLGGGAKSIGLYAAGLAAMHGASVVDYRDDDPARRDVAESFGARTGPGPTRSAPTTSPTRPARAPTACERRCARSRRAASAPRSATTSRPARLGRQPRRRLGRPSVPTGPLLPLRAADGVGPLEPAGALSSKTVSAAVKRPAKLLTKRSSISFCSTKLDRRVVEARPDIVLVSIMALVVSRLEAGRPRAAVMTS
jgi:threonine dehydrogenase-like Zn-dependent dehydrogenase